MNPVIDQIHRHRSIRKYKSKDVPDELLDEILQAGTMASSSGNMQTYSIIVTKDLETRKKMMPAHFNQSMVVEAPVLLTFCADFHRMRRWLKLSKAKMNFDNYMSFMIAAIDAVLVSQNVALAAESEGLGICYMGTTLASCLEIAEILECPENVVPVVGFSLGYPDETPEERKRLPIDCLIHREKYQQFDDDEIKSSYGEREKLGWKRYMEIDELKRKVEEAEVENLAQVYSQVKYTRESHLEYSQTVLACLEKQGFMNNY